MCPIQGAIYCKHFFECRAREKWEKWSLLQSSACQRVTVYSLTEHTKNPQAPITYFHPKLNFALEQSFHALEILVCPFLPWLYFVSCDLFGLTDRKSALIWWVSLAVHTVMSGKTLLCRVVITEIGAFPIWSKLVFHILVVSAVYIFLS